MKKYIKLKQIIKVIKELSKKTKFNTYNNQDDNQIIQIITEDSRKITENTLFAAFLGTHRNGADFIKDAIENDAVAILTDETNYPQKISQMIGEKKLTHIITENPRKLFAQIANAIYPNKPEYLIGITGTNGKTSTCEFVRQIFATNDIDSATMGTLGVFFQHESSKTELTTPEPFTMHQYCSELAEKNCHNLIMEVTSHALIEYRVDALNFDIVAFTNLSQDHLDYHKTMDEYFNAKKILFENLSENHKKTKAVIYKADEYADKLYEILQQNNINPIAVQIENNSQNNSQNDSQNDSQHNSLSAQIIEKSREKQKIKLKWEKEQMIVNIPLIGEFQLRNVLLAIAIVIASQKLPFEKIARAAEKLKTVKGRMQFCSRHNGADIFVDYAHTPEALKETLKACREINPNNVKVVFGCAGERDKKKRKIMAIIAQEFADHVYVTDDNPRSENPQEIRREIIKHCPKAIEFFSRKEAIQYAVENLRENDVLVVAGKGHETVQDIKGVFYQFDDYRIIKDIISNIKK